MKKIITILISIMIALTMTVAPVFAIDHIPGNDTVSSATKEYVEGIAQDIKDEHGVEVILLLTDEDVSINSLVEDYENENGLPKSYFLLAITSQYYRFDWSSNIEMMVQKGDDSMIIGDVVRYDNDGNPILDPDTVAENYFLCMKQYFDDNMSAETREPIDQTATTSNYTSTFRYIQDQAEVLTKNERADLNNAFKEFAANKEMDLVVVFTSGLDPSQRQSYADDFFDDNGYGVGEDRDGALLLVNVKADGSYSEGNAWISTSGAMIDLLSDERISEIGSEITPMLVAGQYAQAAEAYKDKVSNYLVATTAKSIGIKVLVTLLVAIGIAFLYTTTLKGQLKSVQDAYEANDYVVDNSMKITNQYDHFLYADVVSVKIEKEDKGGSSTHTSSSGNTHGGGGF